MVGTLCQLFLALTLAAQTQDLKKEYWDSVNGLFRTKVPVGWSVAQKTSGFFEDVRMGPRKEPTVSLTVLTRRHFKPMTSIDNDRHLRAIIADYKKKYQAVKIEKGPNRVPIGNEDSWSYLLIYNMKATDGSKVSVRETISYINRRLGDLAYVHHILIGRVPLPVAFEYSAKISDIYGKFEFFKLKVNQADPSAKPAPPGTPTDEEDEDAVASPAPGASPAAGSPAPGAPGHQSAPGATPGAHPSVTVTDEGSPGPPDQAPVKKPGNR